MPYNTLPGYNSLLTTTTHTGSGNLAASGSAVSGAGNVLPPANVISGSGAIQANDSTVNGAAVSFTIITGSGNLVVTDSQVSGRSENIVPIMFIVEDGAGVENANSLVSLEFADAFHAARLNTSWANLDENTRKANLIKGSDYFMSTYCRRLPGCRKTADQTFHFPASGAYYTDGFPIADDTVPKEVQRAVAELGLLSSQNDLLANPVADASLNPVRERTRTLGPLTTKTVFQAGTITTTISQPVYPTVNQFLCRLLSSTNEVIRN